MLLFVITYKLHPEDAITLYNCVTLSLLTTSVQWTISLCKIMCCNMLPERFHFYNEVLLSIYLNLLPVDATALYNHICCYHYSQSPSSEYYYFVQPHDVITSLSLPLSRIRWMSLTLCTAYDSVGRAAG